MTTLLHHRFRQPSLFLLRHIKRNPQQWSVFDRALRLVQRPSCAEKMSETSCIADVLQCNVCMEAFQSSGAKKPKMLPCQHSFCVDCLEVIAAGGRIDCPLCRQIYRTTVDELPNNLVVLQLIDSIGNFKKARKKGKAPPPPSVRPISTAKVADDSISRIRGCCRKPKILLTQLKAFQKVQKAVSAEEEHISAILQCVEQYSKNLQGHREIIEACLEILSGMMKDDDMGSLSDLIKERMHMDIMQVLTANNFPSGIRIPCVNVLYNLCNCNLKFQKTYSNASTRTLFGFLGPSQAPEMDTCKLATVLRHCTGQLKRDEREELGNRYNIKNLIGIVKRDSSGDNHILAVFGIFINLTSLAGTPCNHIVQEGGLEFIQKVLKDETHEHDIAVIQHAMEVLSNMAEVEGLREDIIRRKELLQNVVSYLRSTDASTCVLSGKVVAKLSLVEGPEWRRLYGSVESRNAALDDLHKQVADWIDTDPGGILFPANSFKPYFPLLKMYGAPPIQMYAAWWIRKCCVDDKRRYQRLLKQENGLPILDEIKENTYADETLRSVVADILSSVESNIELDICF